MGSSAKKRTTMAKLNRESRLRERRAEKEARKAGRRLAASQQADGVAEVEGGEESLPETEAVVDQAAEQG